MAFLDLGECPKFDVKMETTEKEYITARNGIGTVVKSVPIKATATVDFVLNEITPQNIGYYALGTVETDTDGFSTIISMSKTQREGILKVEGANDVGNKINWTARVSLKSNGSLSMVTDGDDWAAIALQAKVLLSDDYGMGKFEFPEMTDASPDTDNLTIFKGVVYFDEDV